MSNELIKQAREYYDHLVYTEQGQPAQIIGALIEALARSGAVSEDLPAWYGMSKPWPLHDVLSELIRGAEILLDEKDYDGHGHERIATAKKRAREILVGIGLALPAPADSEQVEGDAMEVPQALLQEWYGQWEDETVRTDSAGGLEFYIAQRAIAWDRAGRRS